jgi:hypothetical protein
MTYLLLGAGLVALLVWLGGGKAYLRSREWRFLTGAASVAAFIGAAMAGVRGGWPLTLVLLAAGAGMGLMTRMGAAAPRAEAPPPPQDGKMSLADARATLGVGPDASASEIQTAYARLMRLAHPDKGGTDGLARQLNAARDRLLKG